MRHRALAGLAATAVLLTLPAPAHAAGAALHAGAPQQLSAAPGDGIDVTLSVTNAGTAAVDGAAVTFATTYGFESVERFANCRYDSDLLRSCVFDEVLQPGKTYQVVVPYRVRADTFSAPNSLDGQFGWISKAEAGSGTGTSGDGTTLHLTEAAGSGNSTDSSWQTVGVDVTGNQSTDLVALGGHVSGSAGDVVNVEVGVHNNGPATLDATMSHVAAAGFVVVTIPDGTSVTSKPVHCSLLDESERTKPGAVQYVCDSDYLFVASQTAAWTFGLKIDRVVPDAAGDIEVNPACGCQSFTKDIDTSNDTAPLVVNPSAGGGLDATPPVIADTGIADGQTVPASFTFHPVVTDDVGVVRVEGVAGGSTLATCTSAAGQFTCRALTGTLPDDQDATITLRAYDVAGNSTTAAARVHTDETGPTATLSPARGSSVRSGATEVTLTGVSADTAKIVMSAGTGAELATRTEAPWTFTWDAAAQAEAPCFRLTDRVGNQATICGDYVIDDAAPVVQRVVGKGPYADSVLDTGTGRVGATSAVSATIADASPLSRVEWWVDGALAATGPTFTWDNRKAKSRTATLGIRVWDSAGNAASKSFPVTVDVTGPAATVTPANRALIRGTTFTTTVKASDPAGIARSALKGATQAGSYTSAKVKSGKDGALTVTWIVIDKLGNETDVARVVIVDNTAPALTVTKAPKNNAKLTRTVTLAAKASDRNGVAKVQLLVNGKVVATDAKAAYSFTLNPKKYGKKFTVQLRAYDKAGNVKYAPKRTYRR